MSALPSILGCRMREAGRLTADLNRLQRWLIVPFAVVAMVVGWRAARSPNLTLFAVVGLFAITAAVVAPKPILMGPFVMVFAYWRVGPGLLDMSMTDAMTLFAALAALPFVPWRDRGLRRILMVLVAYLGVVLVAAAISPSVRAFGEWWHRGMLVAGALFVGTAVARLGMTRLALRIFVAACTVISVAAVVNSASSQFGPAYPFGMHKNAVGSQLASALVILLIAHRRLAVRAEVLVVVGGVLCAGLFASQARGAIIALVIVAAFHLVRYGGRKVARLAPIVLVIGIAFMAFAVVSVRNEHALPAEQAKFNSINTRLNNYDFALGTVWLQNPLFGAGPKWFFSDAATSQGFSIPHDMVVAELSETGLAGLVVLVALFWTMFGVLRRSGSDLSHAARFVLAQRILDSLLGIFWVAGTATLPFLVVGLALGEAAATSEPAPPEVPSFDATSASHPG